MTEDAPSSLVKHVHGLSLSYMADGEDETPIAMRAACATCHQSWEFYGVLADKAGHELAAWAVRAREALEKIANKHSSFSSPCQEVDTHQLARTALADYPSHTAS